MSKPSIRAVQISEAVCSRGFSIADTADNFNVSKSTVRRDLDRVTEFGSIERGAASMDVSLSGGVITVRRSAEGEVLLQSVAKDGSWSRIWDVMENELGLTRINS